MPMTLTMTMMMMSETKVTVNDKKNDKGDVEDDDDDDDDDDVDANRRETSALGDLPRVCLSSLFPAPLTQMTIQQKLPFHSFLSPSVIR